MDGGETGKGWMVRKDGFLLKKINPISPLIYMIFIIIYKFIYLIIS